VSCGKKRVFYVSVLKIGLFSAEGENIYFFLFFCLHRNLFYSTISLVDADEILNWVFKAENGD
jgi:hypothetical protein